MAARNINEIFLLVDYICRKQRGVFISIDEFNESIVAANLEAYSYYWELSYRADQLLHDALQPFKVLRYQFTSAADGLVTFPSDYSHLFLGVFTVYGSTIHPCQFLDNEQVAQNLDNQLRPITLSNPIAEYAPSGFQLYPMSQQTGFFSYLRLPAQPQFVGTYVNRVLTYNAAASTQIEFKDIYVNNIIARSLKYFSINMSETEIQQFAQLQQQETQTP